MLVLSVRKREVIELATPSGKVSLYMFGDGSVGIDAPKVWPITRHDLPQVRR